MNSTMQKNSTNKKIEILNDEELKQYAEAFDTLRWVDIPIEDDDEEQPAEEPIEEEEIDETKDRNAGKFIEDEANDGKSDEEEEEDGDYEEDEGEDDEKSKEEELAEHRALKLEKPLKELKLKKAKPGEELLIDDENYEEDGFVVFDTEEEKPRKTKKGIKGEAEDLLDEPLLQRKRKLIKKSEKIIEDDDEEQPKKEEKPKKIIPDLKEFIKKAQESAIPNKFEELKPEDNLIENYKKIKESQEIEKTIKCAIYGDKITKEEQPKEEPNEELDQFKELDNENKDKEIQFNNKLEIFKALFDPKMTTNNFKNEYGEEGEAADNIIIETIENMMKIRTKEEVNGKIIEHQLKKIQKILKGDNDDNIITIKKYICKYFNIEENKIIDLNDEKLVEYKLKDGTTEIMPQRKAELKEEKQNIKEEEEKNQKNEEAKKKYYEKQAEEWKNLRGTVTVCDQKDEEQKEFENELKDFKLLKKGDKLNTKSFGLVIMMEKNKYNEENIEENLNIHIKHCKHIITYGLIKAIEKQFGDNKTILEFIINHEHGSKNKKCHMQCFIKFAQKIQIKLRPGAFTIDGEKYLFIAQKSDTEAKMRQYCKKTRDRVWEWEQYTEIDFGEKGTNIKEWLTNEKNSETLTTKEEPIEKIKKAMGQKSRLIEIFNLPQLDKEDLIQIAKDKDTPCQERLEIIKNIDKIIEFHKKNIEETEELKWEWKWPKYIDEFMDKMNNLPPEEIMKRNQNPENPQYAMEIEKFKIFKIIKKWFFTYCMQKQEDGTYKPNDPDNHSIGTRKKALLIHGPREIGKTILCQSFLIDKNEDPIKSPLIVYCKGAINSNDFINKRETAQLIMLDDINWVQNQKQMLKQIIAGQSTTLRSLNSDKEIWDKNLPCIILTNEIKTFDFLNSASEFGSQVYAISIDEKLDPKYTTYLGPEGTRPNRDEPPKYISAGSRAQIDKLRKDKETKKEMKAMFKVFC